MSILDGKNVLVTGATGSFGKRFVRHVLAHHKPARLVIFSRDELKQFELQQELRSPLLRWFLGDVRDADRLHRAFDGVQVVIHAAAMKQVPASEYNPMEAVKTNIFGAENVINVCIDQGVERVIALSTDKAANPINLYGATKLCSDKLFVAGNALSGKHRTRFSVVRYGNVIGSRGSVIPFFMQKRAGGVIPITDPRMTRFWITLGQGVEFVLDCLERMHGGEIFVPRIPSSRIVDLAEAIAPGMKREIVGIRPGEKLHEVMCPIDDSRLTLAFDDHFVIQPSITFYEHPEYRSNGLGESGTPVELDFEYNSGTNPHFLSVPEIRDLLAITA